MNRMMTMTTNANQVKTVSEYLNKMMQIMLRPMEWLQRYYADVVGKPVSRRLTWQLVKVQTIFFAGIFPANVSLVLRAALLVWLVVELKKCRRMLGE